MTDNPYWEAVRDHVGDEERPWGTFPCVGLPNSKDFVNTFEMRTELTSKYSWTITNPDTVAFVALYAGNGLVDPMAGTGYWAYVLGQMGVPVVCYDKEPGTNHWHEGRELWVPVTEADCETSVALHGNRTLFLSWPPMSNDGARALKVYEGSRVIYIGEGAGGCTGDDDFHDMLETYWNEVSYHRPVQWWGLNDYITVYDRKPA